MLNATDNELFNHVSNDDQAAFRILYDRYWRKLLVHAVVKLESEVEAEELVQEIFLQLWKRRKQIQLKNSFHTYIASMLKYEILARFKKRRQQQLLQQGMVNDAGNTDTNDAAYELLRREIEITIQSLPEKCRLVFRLSRDEGLSEKQIAEQLNIAPKTVEAHISKALKKLRASLQTLLCLYF
ncbi:RNA polymerase sigma factor [Foetidibacter luteolus]|uniref:RNA polymerase sigma factor n=1 Tax=Foetidibacter luteolus TaxID=2608880 RepID=UPI00129B51EA|nr:RNA polymerase sigma-70 factor [Foetidibacter luteolus]